jgi:WD40 repeat protein
MLWDVAAGQLLRTFEEHTGHVNSVAFSPDGTRALSGGADARIAIWDPASGVSLVTLFSAVEDTWLAISRDASFSISSMGEEILHAVRGLELTTIGQVHQSLFSSDLVRDSLAGDPDGEVKTCRRNHSSW